MKPRASELRRFARGIEVNGVAHRARFDTSLPFEQGTINDYCWHWVKKLYRLRGRNICPAKFAYRWRIGPLTDNQKVERTCGSSDCVNPYHGTPVEFVKPGRSICRKGHPLVFDNVYITPHGSTECMQCRLERRAKYANSLK